MPGRVEADIIETEPIFAPRDGQLTRASGMPPRLDRFAALRHRHPRAAWQRAPARRDDAEAVELMGAAVGLMAGVGLLLIWRSFTAPRQRRRTTRSAAVRQLARRAARVGRASSDVSSRMVSRSVQRVVRRSSACSCWRVSRAAPVALAFALLAAYAPIAVPASPGQTPSP